LITKVSISQIQKWISFRDRPVYKFFSWFLKSNDKFLSWHTQNHKKIWITLSFNEIRHQVKILHYSKCLVVIKRNINKEETPSSNGVVWAYFLCCWASKSSCILVFHGFGKKIGLAPPVSPRWPDHYNFFGLLFQAEHFILRSQPPSTTPCPVFLSGNNWIPNCSHYQLLQMLPRKNFFLKCLYFTITLWY
jgi:hypothetical protein